MKMIRRRFLNLVAEDDSTGALSLSLHRLDTAKHLFYRSTAKAEEAASGANNVGLRKPRGIPSLRRLPPPIMHIEPFPGIPGRVRSTYDGTFVLLSPHGSDAARILHAGGDGSQAVVVHDPCSGSTTAMPSLQRPKGRWPIFISIAPGAAAGCEEEKDGGSVYVMSGTHKGHNHYYYGDDLSFQVLDFNRNPHRWDQLPPPPLAEPCHIGSFTVVDGGRIICVSAESNGTYCFDTTCHEWWHAGDWVLPFAGRAEYVPELDTWFGLSYARDHYELCAFSDLSAAMDAHRAPTMHVWKYLDPPPNESEYIALKGRLRGVVLNRTKSWMPIAVDLLNMGGGRFCIATFIRDIEKVSSFYCESDMAEEYSVVLSGVEVVRGSDGERGGLQMVKHKSKRYIFTSDSIVWVL